MTTDDGSLPETLEEAVAYLIAKLNDDDLRSIAAMEQDEFLMVAHFGLGLWIRNNLGLWSDGPLAKSLAGNDYSLQADDMSGIILTALWERLQETPP